MRFANVVLCAGLFIAPGLSAHANSITSIELPATTPTPSFPLPSHGTEMDSLAMLTASPAPQPTAVTPEPSSVVLMATGVLSLALTGIRRRLKARRGALRLQSALIAEAGVASAANATI